LRRSSSTGGERFVRRSTTIYEGLRGAVSGQSGKYKNCRLAKKLLAFRAVADLGERRLLPGCPAHGLRGRSPIPAPGAKPALGGGALKRGEWVVARVDQLAELRIDQAHAIDHWPPQSLSAAKIHRQD